MLNLKEQIQKAKSRNNCQTPIQNHFKIDENVPNFKFDIQGFRDGKPICSNTEELKQQVKKEELSANAKNLIHPFSPPAQRNNLPK